MTKKHNCQFFHFPDDGYGAAITYCWDDGDGKFWVGNGEYYNQVNYCPYCGVSAPVQVEEI